MLENSIQEVEALLIETLEERERLKNFYTDAEAEIENLNNYIVEITTILHRTSLHFYNQLYNCAEPTTYNAIKDLFETSIKNINKSLKQYGGICQEAESYYKEKLKIARCYKNFFSESGRTIATKCDQLTALEEFYDFGYIKDETLPYCPILPESDPLTKHSWKSGIINYYFEEDVGLTLDELAQKYAGAGIDYCDIFLSPKPITRESVLEEDSAPTPIK